MQSHRTWVARGLHQTICAAAVLFLGLLLSAQEALYFSLAREGTASVILDLSTKTAYITDGGRRGPGGLQGVSVDGQDIFDFLTARGVEKVVITCSHPHGDHLEGLVGFVQDTRVSRFALSFVDSGFRTTAGLGSKSLLQHYAHVWGDEAAAKCQHFEATNKNAFETLNATSDAVKVNNFVYDPGSTGAVHGHSIITHYTLSKDGVSTRVVDFDDAESDLVRRWAQWAMMDPIARKPDVVILPHHGSSYTDISPILTEALKPRSFVATVNPANRNWHPGAETVRACIEAVGVEHVHFTGTGDHVAITHSGVMPNDPKKRSAAYGLFLARQEQRARTRYADARAAAAANGQSAEYRRRADAIARELEDFAWIAASMRGDRPPGDEPPPGGPGPSGDGGGGPVGGGDPAGPRTPPSPHGGGGDLGGAPRGPGASGLRPQDITNGTGAFRQLSARAASVRVSDSVEAQVTKVAGRNIGRATVARAARFQTLRVRVPIFGGVMLGNLHAAAPHHACSPAIFWRNGAPVLEVILMEGGAAQRVSYEELTATELWVAYHIVCPNPMMRDLGAQPDEINLVGLDMRRRAWQGHDAWVFAIHPALANSSLAQDGMRLDLWIADAGQHAPCCIPAPAQWESYQWNDAAAAIAVEDGQLVVRANDNAKLPLVRPRFWVRPDYEALDAQIDERVVAVLKANGHGNSVLVRELELVRRLEGEKDEKQAEALRELIDELEETAAEMAEDERFSDLLEAAEAEISAEMLRMQIDGKKPSWFDDMDETSVSLELARRVGARARDAGMATASCVVEWQARNQATRELYVASSIDVASEAVIRAHREFEPLASVERLAKVLVLLRWMAEISDGQLPELPREVQPIVVGVSPVMLREQVAGPR